LGPKGDGVLCPYCYAKKLANGRLKQRYLANTEVANPIHYGSIVRDAHYPFDDPFYPRFWPERLGEPKHLGGGMFGLATIPKGIFTVDMGELFGDWVPREWQDRIFNVIKSCPQHRFYLLTKQPQNLIKALGGNITNTHKGYKKPESLPLNCWAGVTITNRQQAYNARDFLNEVRATVKFLSLEPLLGRMDGWALGNVIRLADWLIIGACTGALNDLKPTAMKYPDLALMPYGKRWALQPKLEWVEEIVEAASKAGIPVFLKNNLEPLLRQSYETFGDLNSKLIRGIKYPSWEWELRQEMPLPKGE